MAALIYKETRSAICDTPADKYRMLFSDIFEAETLELPDIEVGDDVMVGKFKNRKAKVTGFTKDDHNQPVLKTTKGEQKLFKPRLSKLEEGLIAVPPSMEKEIDFYLTFYVLWRMRDRFKGKTKAMPELFAAFKAMVKAFGEKLPPEPFDTSKAIQAHHIKTTVEGLPANYQHLQPRVPYVWFVVDWREGSGSHGVWRPKVGDGHGALAVYPLTLDYLVRYPTPRSHPDDLKVALETMRETIKHELRHMVQSVFLHEHPEQSAMKPDYGKHGAYYYTSPNEFDPIIGSAVQEFRHLWQIYNESRRTIGVVTLKQAVRQFTAIEKSGAFDTFSAHKLFKHLKASEPERYKVAVKKFIGEIQDLLSGI